MKCFSFCVWRFANAYEKIKLKGEDYEEKDYFDSYCGNDDYYDRMWEKPSESQAEPATKSTQ